MSIDRRFPHRSLLRRALLVLAIAAAGGASAVWASAPGAGRDLSAMLPDRVEGYRPRDATDGVYTRDTLYDLIDGAAEVYRSFNVRRVVSRRYVRPDAPDIIADVFDMGSSSDAFGAYHHDSRTEKDAGIGHESEYQGGSLYFWKDRFFVSIVAFAETGQTRRATLAIGRKVAAAIPERGRKPEIAGLLPREGLFSGRQVYFHDWSYLSLRYPLGDRNLLRLDRETEGMLARYRRGGTGGSKNRDRASMVLLLVSYPSRARAEKGYREFLAGFLPNADESGVARRTDGRWTGAVLLDRRVAAALEAAGRGDVEWLLAGVKKRVRAGGKARQDDGKP